MGELSTAGLLVGPPVFAADHLLVFSATGENEGELLAIDPDLKEVRWRRRPERTRWTSARPYLRGDGILVGSETGRIAGFAPADGSHLWSDTLPGTVRGIGWDQDVLYVGMMDGTLYAYRPPLTPAASPPAPQLSLDDYADNDDPPCGESPKPVASPEPSWPCSSRPSSYAIMRAIAAPGRPSSCLSASPAT